MKNELLEKFPNLEKEWNVSKNGMLPDRISLYSGIKYYFNCIRCNGKEYYIALKDWFRRQSHQSKICRHYPKNQVRKAKLKVSLASHSPELILEWSSNNKEDYNLINYGSEKVVEWKCSKCSSIFNQSITKRCCDKVGCPYCTSKRVNDTNSLEISYPELSGRLLKPLGSKVNAFSAKLGTWRCFKCNEVFNSRIYCVVKAYKEGRSGCIFCAGKKVNHKNNLLATHPEICAEWDYSKNNKSPEEYTAGSRYKVWWICCKKGHSWQASINGRTGVNNQGSGCPYCSCRISKVEKEWLNYLNIDDNYRQATIRINGKKYSVDAYVPETNTIYEFWGDYYHGNPNIYNLDDMNQKCKKTFRQLYEATVKKQELLIRSGYNLVCIWESDWRILRETII